MRWMCVLLLVPATCLLAAEPDLSSPKSAAKSLFDAISTADRDAVRASLYAENDEQAQLAAAMADLIVAGKKLGDAAQARFGKAGDPIGRGMLDPSDLSKIEAAVVTENGDQATLQISEQPRPMSFRRRDGKWKLVVTDYAGAKNDTIDRQIKLVQLMGEAMETSAKELSSGQYKTAEEAVNGIQQRLHGVMLAFYRPATTRATTAPATGISPSPSRDPAKREAEGSG